MSLKATLGQAACTSRRYTRFTLMLQKHMQSVDKHESQSFIANSQTAILHETASTMASTLQAVQKSEPLLCSIHCFKRHSFSQECASQMQVVSKHQSRFLVLLESHYKLCALKHATYTSKQGVSEQHMPSLLDKGCSNLRPNFGIVLD